MSDELEDLFSPERLGARWQAEPEAERPAEKSPPATPPALEELARFERLVSERFAPRPGDALMLLLGDLRRLVGRRLVPLAGKLPAPAERAALGVEISQLLTQLEDLIEAREVTHAMKARHDRR